MALILLMEGKLKKNKETEQLTVFNIGVLVLKKSSFSNQKYINKNQDEDVHMDNHEGGFGNTFAFAHDSNNNSMRKSLWIAPKSTLMK